MANPCVSLEPQSPLLHGRNYFTELLNDDQIDFSFIDIIKVLHFYYIEIRMYLKA